MARDNLQIASKVSTSWFGYGAAVFCCAVFVVLGASAVWPPMDGDAAMLFPSAVELARGNGFVNTPWIPPMNDTIDGPGGRRHISHGFLSQLLIGLAASVTGADAPQCVAWSYIVIFLASVVCGAAVLCWRHEDSGSGFLGFLVGFVSVSGSFALAFAWIGRVEPMVMLWAGCAILALRCLPMSASLFACGVAVGLMAWTSPLSAFVGALLLGIYMVLRAGALDLRSIALAAVGGLAATAASFAIYPYAIQEWIGGTIRHSKIHFDHPAFQGLLQSWVARPHTPLLVLTVGLLICGALMHMMMVARSAIWWRKALVGIGCLVLIIAVFRLTVVRGEAVYNIVPFIPVLAAICMRGTRSVGGSAMLILALLLPTLGLARSSVLLASQIANGPRYKDVRTCIAEKMPGGILVSKGLWLAVPDLGRVTYGRPGYGCAQPRWFIDQQVATGRATPAEYSGYRLVDDRFTGPVRIFGFPISSAPTGWQYALYEKVPAGD